MKTLLASTALVLLASLTACSSDATTDQVAADPAPTTSTSDPDATSSAEMPPAPASPGTVSTRGLVTVVERGDGPQVCLGATTAVAPPTCTGPGLVDWTWEPGAEEEGGTRWGSYALTGTWDGRQLTVTDAIGAALYDAAVPPTPPALPQPQASYGAGELEPVAERLADLPGALGATSDDAGHVLVDVAYDDGSLQAWATQQYGVGVVVVTGELVDAG